MPVAATDLLPPSHATKMLRGEKAIKALQKEALCMFEEELIDDLSPHAFNTLRKLVFRTTFLAYRLGIVGPAQDPQALQQLIEMIVVTAKDSVKELDTSNQHDLFSYCLEVWLDAFRIGAQQGGNNAV
jgi:hypothetical protein